MTGAAIPTARKPFADAPWRDIDAAGLGPASAVPTMLSAEECAFYYWLAAHWARDAGAVVDLGCFAGGSTARLAAGLAAAGSTARIHAYDRFTVNRPVKLRVLYPAGVARFRGRDILPLARRFLAPWEARIALHPGEIEDEGWAGGPVELLIVDAAKTDRGADRIAAQFFPALIAGRSVVVQEDFLHWRQPWLIAQAEALADCFELVALCAQAMAAFLVHRVPEPAELQAARTEAMDDSRLIELLQAARERHRAAGLAPRVEEAIAAIRANPGRRIAWKMKRPGRGGEAPAK